MQKLVTIYLDNGAYGKGKMIVGSYDDKHKLVEEHLQEYLSLWVVYNLNDKFWRQFRWIKRARLACHCAKKK